MTSPRPLIATVVSESRRLTDYLRGLRPADWRRATACDRWTAADVIAHLSFGAKTYTNLVRVGREGRAEPRPLRLTSASIADTAVEHRKALGDGVLDDFIATDSAFNQALLSLGEQDFDKTTYYRGNPVPLWFVALARLTELAIHEWDIRSPVEPGFHLSPAAVTYLIERMPEWVDITYRKAVPLPVPVRYRFQLASSPSRAIDFTITGDRCQVSEAGDAKPDVTYALGPEDYVLLHFGRLDYAKAVQQGRIKVSGDGAKAAQFPGWFQRR
ncbi:MAG: maleylpyruvate isomerase family mycothiol-dependent enzyme [Chloroflexi bacterium]|nr:maleylpyruvate isomerase family mycothiol-dependent enzyme [Chloroflexota bacterium]